MGEIRLTREIRLFRPRWLLIIGAFALAGCTDGGSRSANSTEADTTTVMSSFVERAIELGIASRSSSAPREANAFGNVEFLRGHFLPLSERSPADDIEDVASAAPVSSRLIAHIRTTDGAPIDPSAIEHVVIGIRPNDLFRTTIADRDLWTASNGPILRQLDRADRTFVVLWAKGYRLARASAENLLELKPDFTPGKPISLDLVVASEGIPVYRPTLVSAAGTTAELPPFRD